MNALESLRQSESRLVASIEQATAAVDAIGTSRVEGALANLEDAVSRARQRLDNALAGMQSLIGGLASEFDAATSQLEADAAPSNPAPVPQDAPAPVAPPVAPSPAPEAPEGTQEPAPTNRIAELIGADPSPNGTGHKPKGKPAGKRPRK